MFAFSYPLLLLAIWTGVLIAGDGIVLETSTRQVLAGGFATTTGEIMRSEIGRGTILRRGVEIGYSYTVNGMDYTGRRYRYDDRNGAFDYNSVTNAFRPGTRQTVYYDPDDPAESVLSPGLHGFDLLLALFAIPLNVLTCAVWLAAFRARRDSRHPRPAGGIRILTLEGETRARLAAFSPWAAGFFALAAAAFTAAMAVVLAAGFAPSLRLLSAVLILVAAAGVTAFLWTARRHHAGRYDLRIPKGAQTLVLPPAGGRKEPLIVGRAEIASVSMRRRVSDSPSGQYLSYVPALERAGPGAPSQSLHLVTWGWKEGKARAFADWLSQQLEVPFKGVEEEREEAPAWSQR